MNRIGAWQLAFVYAGCFLGAGYVSGQEILQFFGAFGVIMQAIAKALEKKFNDFQGGQ